MCFASSRNTTGGCAFRDEMIMPKNLSWSLFLGWQVVMAAAFALAMATVMDWFGDAHRDSQAAIAFVSGALYLAINGSAAWSMYADYRGFCSAVDSTWIRSLIFFLMPGGAYIGGVLAQDGFGADPTIGWLVGAVALSPVSIELFLWLFGNEALSRERDPDYIRGTKLRTLDDAQRRALALPRAQREPQIYWGGLVLPERCSSSHFVILGPTGSGKTVTLRLLMQSILPRIRQGSNWRAVIYDPKNEFLPLLSGMPLHCPVLTLHPYDRRGVAWDIARDITDRSIALSLSANLISSPEGQNKFFYMAAQSIFSSIMEAFIVLAPELWTLRDVLLVMQDEQTIKRLLLSLPQTRPTYRKYFEGLQGDTLADVRATLDTETERLEPIAALWDRAPMRISLKDWARDSYILVLGKDQEIATPLDNVNRVLFQRISQIFTKQGTGRTWVFVDEAKFAGKIPGLDDLMTTGRSFGARVCLTTLDVAGFEHAYGKEEAHELLGGAGNRALLGTWNPETAKYAASVMGKAERIERTKSRTNGTGYSTTENERIVQSDVVMPDEFLNVDLADERCFFGYYATQAVGRYGGWLYHGRAMHPCGNEPKFLPRPGAEQYLRPWSTADRQRLGTHLADLLFPEEPAGPFTGRWRSHLDDIDLN